MNRVYRLVFNRALGVPQVASELACRHGIGATAGGASVRRVRLASLVALSLAGLAGPAAATDYTWASGWYTTFSDPTTSSSVAPPTLAAGDLLTLTSGADKLLGCAPTGPNCDGRQDLLIGTGATVAHAAGNLLFGSTGSVLTNQGTYDLQGDVSITGDNSNSGGQFDNQGELLKSAGTGTAHIGGVHFVNSGTVRVLAGTLQFDGDSQGGPEFNDGGVIDTGVAQGIVSFANGATFTGTTTAIGASLNFDGGLFWGNSAVLLGSEAWLRNSANLVGSWTLDGGTLYTNGASIVGGLEVGNGATLNLVGITWLAGQGSIHVATGGLIGVSNGDLLGGGPVTNDGTIRKTIPGTTAFDAALTNRGRVEIDTGGLQLPDTFINDGTVQLRNGGTLQAGDGTAVFRQSATGRVVIGDEIGDLQGNSAGTLAATTLQGGTLVVNASLAPDLRLAQMQALEVNNGDLTLRGDNSTFGGSARVDGGGSFLWVQDGVLGGAVMLTNGGHLGGSGTVAGDVDAQDGALQLGWGSDSQFHIGGALRLGANSRLNAILGAPNDLPAAQARLTVGGDLVLDGGLALSATQDMGAGVYRLIDYGGALTDNGLDVYGLPSNLASQVQSSIAHQVNLVVTAAGDDTSLSFWNGNTLSPTGTVVGGYGTWSAGTRTNWTNANGTVSRAWNGRSAVFQANPGVVAVSGDDGEVKTTGMQFMDGEWWVSGDGQLTLDGQGGDVVVRVGDGTAAGAAWTAHIGVPLTGNATLVKTDLGRLVLTGSRSWTGDTRVEAGTLQLGSGGGTTFGGTFTVAAGATLENWVNLSLNVPDLVRGSGQVVNRGGLLLQGQGVFSFPGTLRNLGLIKMFDNSYLRLPGGFSNEGILQVTGGALHASDDVLNQSDDGILYLGGTIEDGPETSGQLAFRTTVHGGRVVFNHTDIKSYDLSLSQVDRVDVLAGYTSLSQDSPDFGGTAVVTGGELNVHALLGGNALVSGTGILSGDGRLSGSVAVNAGGTLSGVQGEPTLRIDGDLLLGDTAVVRASLYAPDSQALFAVGGNLTLDGALRVTDAGLFGQGVYRLFDYGGTLTDNGLDVGALPNGTSGALQTSVDKQVNLVVSGGDDQTVSFWNGTTTIPDGQVHGGSGTWVSGVTNWTNPAGTDPRTWNELFAVFQGTPGTVTLGETVYAAGLQLVGSGWMLQGARLYLEQFSDGEVVVRVGDGSAGGAASSATIASDIRGDSTLVKDDLGTLVLTGNGSWQHGTVVRNGTLQIGDGGTAGAIVGDVRNAGTLVFDRSDAVDFAGAISGAGTLAQAGGGTLRLTGDSSAFSGTTQVRAGTLEVDGALGGALAVQSGAMLQVGNGGTAGTIAGNVANAGTLAFARSDAVSFAGAISGAGTLTQAGGGTLRLTGNSSAFAGTTQVRAGTLAVDGRLGGALAVGSGARLQGNGSVGATTVQAGATIAPGNSIGTLSVNGNYVQQAGSTYAVEIDPSGASDRIAVSGTATLQGGTVAVSKAAGTYLPGTSFDILTAAGGVSGRFDALTQDLPFVDLSLRYGANDVLLQVARNAVAFCEVAATGNQCAAGGGVESVGSGALYEAVASLPDQARARAAFDALSGEIHADTRASLLLQSAELRQALDERRTDGGGVWAQALGAWGHLNGDGNAAQVKEDHQGLAFGADLALGEHGVLGALAGYSDGSLRNDARASSMDARGLHLGVHGGMQTGRFELRAGVTYSDYRLDSRRAVYIEGLESQRLRAGYDAQLWQGFASAKVALTPVLGAQLELAHAQARTDAFDEHGGSAALHVASGTSKTDTAGAWLVLNVPSADQRLRVDARLGLRHRFGGDAVSSMEAQFDGGARFQVLAPRTGRDAVIGRFAVDYALGRDSELSLAYAATSGGGAAAHQASLRYTWRF